MTDLSVQEFVDAGTHIGCRVSRWNPKMEPFIYGTRNRIHIIDLRQTIRGILRARHFIKEVVASGQDVIFVGTKRQIQSEILKVHEDTGMHYVDDRWIGGTLTNYEVIGSRIAYLDDLEKKEKEGYLDTLTSKEASRFIREKRKVWRNLHGIRDMFRLPGVMVVVDPRTERNAIAEAKRMGIPVIGIVDTDGDPDLCDLVIPANDDAIRSVALILAKLATAVQAGKEMRAERGVEVKDRDEALAESGIPMPRPTGGKRRRPKSVPGGLSRSVEIQTIQSGAEAQEKPAEETPDAEIAPETDGSSSDA
ncbi:MAG: 30S ribosomal protein S2 [Planctomycetes bacterium]|nr:30S ribosomal protein S2 [Planctomycetota bacterium]